MVNKKIRNDIILIAVILIICLGVFLCFKSNLKSGKSAVVTVNGEKVMTLSLSENTIKKINTDLGENIIEINSGVVNISQADCPDKICVHHRAIKSTGETIVCLPHKLVVEIAGE